MSRAEIDQKYKLLASTASNTILKAWQGERWTAIVSAWFVLTILFTYGTCLHQGHCSKGPWDSISHSWENPPGSYVSRFVVGYCSNMIGVFHIMLYVSNTITGRAAVRGCCHCFTYTNELLLGLGLLACFCLSWVGAICDADDDPLCEGNNTIHSTNAVLFFFLTDVIAFVMTCIPQPSLSTKFGRLGRAFLAVALFCATAMRACRLTCKLLGDRAPAEWQFQDGDNSVIITEVIEVTTFVLFMNSLASAFFSGIHWAAVTSPVATPDGETHVAFPARFLAKAGPAAVLVCLALSYGIAVHNGTVAPLPHVPFFDELIDHKPTNWLGRWFFVQASHAGLWVALFAQVAEAEGIWTVKDYLLLGLQTLTQLSLAGVAIINKMENPEWHDGLVNFFFAFGNAYAILSTLQVTLKAPKMSLRYWCAVLACLTSARTFFDNSDLQAVLQWANLLLLFGFWVSDTYSRPATESMGLAVLFIPPAPAATVEVSIVRH